MNNRENGGLAKNFEKQFMQFKRRESLAKYCKKKIYYTSEK